MEQLADVMVIQHTKQYRFFATYGMFRLRKLLQWHKYIGNGNEGIFLYDVSTKNYETIKSDNI